MRRWGSQGLHGFCGATMALLIDRRRKDGRRRCRHRDGDGRDGARGRQGAAPASTENGRRPGDRPSRSSRRRRSDQACIDVGSCAAVERCACSLVSAHLPPGERRGTAGLSVEENLAIAAGELGPSHQFQYRARTAAARPALIEHHPEAAGASTQQSAAFRGALRRHINVPMISFSGARRRDLAAVAFCRRAWRAEVSITPQACASTRIRRRSLTRPGRSRKGDPTRARLLLESSC